MNIVWICADDFTPDFCGAYGNSLVQTPSLDRLARQSMVFERAYCNAPLSTPSRQSFWTGRYPRSIGVTLSPTPLPESEVTLPAIFRENGYEIATFGKTHFYAPRAIEHDVCIDWPDYEDQGHAYISPVDSGATLGPWRPFLDEARIWLNSDCLPYPAHDEEMFGTFLANHASKYLSQPRKKPFFAFVSFYETHSPFWFPMEYRGHFDRRMFKVPKTSEADEVRIPRVFRNLTASDKQGIAASYATSTKFMDKNVGLILEAIDNSQHCDDTIVLFTSDHGYLLGQHGRFEKHCCLEPACRAALLIRMPKRMRLVGSSEALVELVDLAPTLLELCSIHPPESMQGRSLTPILLGNACDHRSHVITAYADNEEIMIRDEKWKFIYSTGNRCRQDGYETTGPSERPLQQLYDLENDPEETVNLVRHPKFKSHTHHLSNLLIEYLRQTDPRPETIPDTDDCHKIFAQCLGPVEAR